MNRKILFLFLAFVCSPSFAISISALPTDQAINFGEIFSIDITIADLHAEDPGEVVSAFDLALGYDPSLLTPLSVTFGTFLDDPDSVANFGLFDPFPFSNLAFDLDAVGYVGPFTAAVEFGQLSSLSATTDDPLYVPGTQVLIDLQPDSFVLATLSFLAIGVGASALGIIENDTSLDIKGIDPMTALDLIVNDAEVSIVAAVPSPGTLSLLLLGVVFACRRPLRRR